MSLRNNWKNAERAVASFFHTKRTPLSGSNSGHTSSDTLHSRLFIEAKYSSSWPMFGDYRTAKKTCGVHNCGLVLNSHDGVCYAFDLRELRQCAEEGMTYSAARQLFSWTVLAGSRFRPVSILRGAEKLAEAESKIPFVTLREKGSPVILAVVSDRHFQPLYSYLTEECDVCSLLPEV